MTVRAQRPKDPPRRADGRCARYPACKKRLAEITPRHWRYGGAALLEEPFCSTECCKIWHGVGPTVGQEEEQ